MVRETGYTEELFTHEQYRRAGVARIRNEEQTYEFYYHGKLIEKEEADRITQDSQRQLERSENL